MIDSFVIIQNSLFLKREDVLFSPIKSSNGRILWILTSYWKHEVKIVNRPDWSPSFNFISENEVPQRIREILNLTSSRFLTYHETEILEGENTLFSEDGIFGIRSWYYPFDSYTIRLIIDCFDLNQKLEIFLDLLEERGKLTLVTQIKKDLL